MTPRTRYTFFIDDDQREALGVIKGRDGISESEQIRRALNEWIRRNSVQKTGDRMIATDSGTERGYEFRRGYIEVLDSSSGHMRCAKCGAVWWSNLRSGGKYHRGSWTCHSCGANSKGKISEK